MWIWEKLKPGLSRFVPKHVNDPFGLIGRMLASKNRAALFTLWLTGLGLVLSPVDWALQFAERRRKVENDDDESHGPHIVICGPARSGTTLVYQVLASALPVSYARNFTVLFSRAPILASKYLTRNHKKGKSQSFQNYYGKTAGMQAPSEANHLWNQWVDSDASGFRTKLSPQGLENMAQFFKQFSKQSGLPTLSKNNNANAFADEMAQRQSNTYFICLRRDKRYLAQSLLRAREEINGDIEQSYGVTDSELENNDKDPMSQVIKQIEYLDELAIAQQAKIGAERFWIVDYESFCANPEALITKVKQVILGQTETQLENTIPEIVNNNRITDPVMFKQIEERLAQQSL